MKIIVRNTKPRWISLPNKIDLAPGDNELEAQQLEDVRHLPVVESLFKTKALVLKDAKDSDQKKSKKA